MANEFVARKGLIVSGSARITGSLRSTDTIYAPLISASVSSSTIYLNGTETITGSLQISGSTTQTGNTTLTGYLQLKSAQNNIDSSISASYVYVSGSTNDLYFTQNGNGHNNTVRLRWLEGNLYTGILNGGTITAITGSTTFNISAGSGIVVDVGASLTDDPYPVITPISWGAQNNIPLLYSASGKITYVGIDKNGAIVQQLVPWGNTNIDQWDEEISLGVVLHLSGSVINGVFNAPQISYGLPQKTDDFLRAFGPLKISGHTLQASGSSPTLSIKKTGGSSYREGSNYTINPSHPSTVVENDVTVSKIYRYYVSGSTTVIDTGPNNAGYTTLDNQNYVNTAGTLTSVGNNNWSIQRVFWFPNAPTNAFAVYYGNASYPTLLDAINAKDSEPFTEASNTALNAIFIGYIVVQGKSGADLLNSAESTIIPAGLFRNVGGIGSSGVSPVSTALSGLSDVNLSSPSAGDLLVYSGAVWNNKKTLNGTYVITGSLTTTTDVLTANVSASFITSSQVGNPNSNLILFGSASHIDSGSVEIHGGLNWKRTPTAVSTEIGDLITFGATVGVYDGAGLTTSSAGGLTVQVAEMVAYTMTTFPYASHNITKFNTIGSSAASRQLTLPSSSARYVYYNNSGTLTHAATAPSSRSNIILGRVITDETKIIYIDATQINAHHYANYVDRFLREAVGSIFYTGGIVTQGTTSGSLNVTAATYYFSQTRITTNGASPATLHTFYRSGSSGQYNRTTGVATVSTSSYDHGSGILANIPSGKYVKHSLYMLGDNSLQTTANEEYLLVYGQTTYDTLGDAVAGSLPTPPSYFIDQIASIASIVVTPNSQSIQSIIDERPRLGFISPSKTGVITAHGDLTGLTNDDHPQYFLTDGTRTITGNTNFGGYDIGNANDITAKSLVVSSSTVPLKVTAPTGSILFVTSSARVGINLINPQYALHVSGNIFATDDVTAFSDARVKKNVQTIENPLQLIEQLRGVRYHRIEQSDIEIPHVGFIAQEVKEILPEVVVGNEEHGYGVSYGNITALLLEAIKHQQRQIDELKARLA